MSELLKTAGVFFEFGKSGIAIALGIGQSHVTEFQTRRTKEFNMKKLLIVAALGLMAIGFTLSADNASAEDFTPPPCACAGCVTHC